MENEKASSEKTLSETERWTEAVGRMIELTQSGELEWKAGDDYGPGWGDPTTPPYIAVYKGTIYRLQGSWVKVEDVDTPLGRALRNLTVHTTGWMSTGRVSRDGESVRLEIIDKQGHSLYRIPVVSPVHDLLRTVQRQTANPERALEDLLG
jgi:hypothetical protein